MDGWTDGELARGIWMHANADEWTDGWKDGWRQGWADGWMDGRIGGRLDGRTAELVQEWMKLKS